MHDDEIKALLVDYMGRGFLDNIIALFRQDATVYPFIADMLGSDNIRVRLGATALVEELVKEHRQELLASVPRLIGLLRHENPTIRGDAASVLGIIKDKAAERALREILEDGNPGVREAARDALFELGHRN
jgi:HEAT repeat protein